ncbi:MAG: hypothetical protein A3D92_15505 [Bacteroidetes bacterium RIFCSPHIGHO2_02_FULL_44_7]|nr:MAG: hypothetical protein A3D92_15505 [Bacteroidetes bacterium RIFCSPHIGHO2_02_FULL_44_7]
MNNKNFLHVDLTDRIIKSAIAVHKTLGPGFNEIIYERALMKQLGKDGINYEDQKRIDIYYLEERIGYHFLDLIIDNKVIVELKAISELSDVYLSQVISYLKATGLKVGLVLNFATPTLEIKRVAV